MAMQLERHLFTLEEYERIVEAGGFDESARIELIRGEIADMAPIGLRHEACVTRLSTLLVRKAGDNAVVWSQNSIRLPNQSRPEPDVSLLRWRDDYYANKHPMPADVPLVVEVAESSLGYDRKVKAQLYAEAGIPDYWIINLQDSVVEIFTEPVRGRYKQVRKAKPGETLPLPGALKGEVQVSEILGG